MIQHLLSSLSLFGPRQPKPRKRTGGYRRKLSMEPLESREMLSITQLANLSAADDTGEKPQSKVFEYAGNWWTVMPGSSGATVYRLDGTSWTATQSLPSGNGFRADVKVVDDLAHVLLFDGSSSQLATLQYDPADNRFEPWSLRPQVVAVPISSSAEMATLEVDSTGRMWVAYDVSSSVEVRYSDGLYTSWSAPITLGSLGSDDISDIVAMPNGKIGVMWSNQSADRFGFRVHVDGAAPTAWSADEVPASQSALSVGGGMADDHIHLASASDGTVYAAVKTSYDSSSYPKIALLVRRPNGQWDNLYLVDTSGTRGIVVVNEAAGKLIVAYTQGDHASNIVYRESPLGNIAFGPRQVLMSGSLNDVTSTKYTSTNEIVFLANSRGALFSFDVPAPIPNAAPFVDAGPNRSIALGGAAALDGTVSDDGRPTPSTLGLSWTKVSGPGAVAFANSSASDTTASFSAAGVYVLRLTASDGALSAFDEVTVTVSETPTIVKSVRASDGTLYELDSAHWLKVNGSRVWAGTHDYGVDANGMVYWHSVGGTLGRRHADKTWEFLDSSVMKFAVSQAGDAYSLADTGWLSFNGGDAWANTKDFTLNADGSMYWLETSNILYARSNAGSWSFVEHDVSRFAATQDGSAYALRSNGWVSLNGNQVWGNTHDFILAENQTLYLHSTDQVLSKMPSGSDWQLLGQNVVQFGIRQDGEEYVLYSDGSVRVGGAVQYTGVSEMVCDVFGRLRLEHVGGAFELVAGQFTLSRRL
jgi:hypothetical protein